MRNARVFISCGQRTEREIEIGKSVENYFKNLGFETYFAEIVHSPEALTENIFSFLRKSEYFIFIDFKRDEISPDVHRGSLFVNQEIAIATYLGLTGIGFLEKGVKREGILDYQIYNPILFEDGITIINNLDGLIQMWDKNNVNELVIAHDPTTISRNVKIDNMPGNPISDWYHLNVQNRHRKKHAFSCLGYISRIKNLTKNQEIVIPTNELIWAGTGDFTINILAGTKRELDAFYWLHGEEKIHFQQRALGTNNPKYSLPSLSKGKYLIEYMVVASNFETVSQTFLLEFENPGKGITFEEEFWH